MNVIKTYSISLELLQELLEYAKQKGNLILISDLKPYLGGFSGTGVRMDSILYDKTKHEIVVTVHQLILCGKFDLITEECKYWQQVRLRANNDDAVNQVQLVAKEVNGLHAYHYMHKVILEQYTEEEYDRILKSLVPNGMHEWHADYVSRMIEVKDTYDEAVEKLNEYADKMLVFENCYYYDLNSAYLSELSRIFPKCKDRFAGLYAERKQRPELKKYFNYFVGMMAQRNRETDEVVGKYPNARAYIVGNVHRTLQLFVEKYRAIIKNIVYVNTDGLIVQIVPQQGRPQPSSHELGEFKIEAEGTCRLVRQKNYTIFKIGDVEKGTLRLKYRSLVDWDHRTVPVIKSQINRELNIDESQLISYKELMEEYI